MSATDVFKPRARLNLPSTICQKIVIPSLQLVSTTNGIKNLLAGLQTQMIGVVQAEATASIFQLFGSDALKRSLGGHRHEDW